MPADGGIVVVPEPHEHGLSGGYPYNRTAEVYVLSVFHQLHCLRALMGHLDLLQQAADSGQSVPDIDARHTNHCFDYLQQSLMCSSDMTLEKVLHDENDQPIRAVDGWGVTHQCRQWATVAQFAREHGDGKNNGKLEQEFYKGQAMETA